MDAKLIIQMNGKKTGILNSKVSVFFKVNNFNRFVILY